MSDFLTQIPETKTTAVCYHCGDPCEKTIHHEEKDFCCHGCKTVYEILSENELCDYYNLESNPGISQSNKSQASLFDFLDNESIKNQLLDFASEDYERVTFHIPNIHCSSCIWLLENLGRLNAGILDGKVDFVKKRLTLHYVPAEINLRQLAELLDSIGYSPSIKLDEEEKNEKAKSPVNNLIIKLGVAGFCFGNVMLLSFPDYLGLTGIEKTYSEFFRYLNMLLAIPVVLYSGAEYLTSAFKSIKQRYTNIDVPIALGIIVLFVRSSYEVLSNTGPGYFDSLVGLIFFLLIGKWFQAKTYQTLSFERNYKSYFPLAIRKKVESDWVSTPVKELKKGDQIMIRNNEIIPGDAILTDEEALIDYSFVTGESEPVRKLQGQYIYAGGRQVGSSIQLVIQKEISQSYLTKLWNDEAFSKEKSHVKLVDRISQYFTLAIIALAVFGAIFWQFTDPAKTWMVFSAVLIVACPCALALSTPFTVGSVMRTFGRNKLYLKNADVVEKLSSVSDLVFDKTGTLTTSDQKQLEFKGTLSEEELEMISKVATQSTHPLSRRIADDLGAYQNQDLKITDFREFLGQGIEAKIDGILIRLGSLHFLGLDKSTYPGATRVFVEVDGKYKGYYELKTSYRAGIQGLIKNLSNRFGLGVLSGDNSGEQKALSAFFPKSTKMFFNQGPDDKLNEIKQIQEGGGRVMMLGDGLNDAGALRQSDIGIAVTEDTSHFSPASDAILEGASLSKLDRFMKLGQAARRIIIASFVLSVLYNVVGISLALSGQLTPLFAAILMPLSSISVVVFTTLMVRFVSKKLKLK